ncbi:hypothetical protein, partial [Klebsiella pneumoniae]
APQKHHYTLNQQVGSITHDLTVITSSYLAENRSISVELSKDNQKILPTTNYRPALISRGLSHSCPHLILPRVCH